MLPMESTTDKQTILLINPHYHNHWNYGVDRTSFPINVLSLGSVLKQAGFNPIIIDTCVDQNYLEIIDTHLPKTLLVGISAMTPQVPHALSIARRIREKSPDTPIVWGGVHPTLYPDTCLHPCCDAVAVGEADETVVELAEALRSSPEIPLLPGLVLNRDGKAVSGPTRSLPDVRRLPWPDYSLIDPEKYICSWSLQEMRMVRVMPILSARGCPWHCTFCINTTLNDTHRHRTRPAEDLLDEIEGLVQKYDLEMIIFSDEEFFADRHRVEALLDGIEKRGLNKIRFNATCRINHFRKGYIDTAFLKRMKQAGFVNLVFGFESGSPRCLEIIRKEIRVEEGLYTARLLASEGFMAVWGFIMGIPGETPADLIKTLHVMNKIRKLGTGNYFIGPQIFRPYPGSALYRKALEAGLTEPGSLDEWASQTFTGEGWIGVEGLKWIPPDHRQLVEYVNTIAPVFYNRQFITASGLKRLYHSFLRLMFSLRLATDIYTFPFEHRLKNLFVGRHQTESGG